MMKSKTKAYMAIYWRKWKDKNRPDKVKICNKCGLVFEGSSNGQKRCINCRTIKCATCGKIFTDKESQQNKYCSPKCYGKSRAGIYPENLHGKRGVKPRTALQNSARLKHGAVEDIEWRNKVFKRDNWTCKKCGKVGGKLEAHHIKPFKKYPELRFDLNNGTTLCKDPCHKETDSYGWKNYWKNYK